MINEVFDRLVRNLHDNIPDSEVAVDTAARVLRLRRDGREYTLRVDEDVDPDAVDRWDIAHELCRTEGLELVLTNAGIRLASSN